ncbi:hypothetical protein D5086_011946 [Populus alba]|uniref:Uncharacterized protein n=1 Tax=Populus alba TaxID=43335 RepID=A0ACC4C0S4_POPAL
MEILKDGQRDWAQVPADILEYIASKVSVADYHRFLLVCTAWRRTTSMRPPSSHLPWLMLSNDRNKKTRRFFCLHDSKFYQIPLPRVVRRSWIPLPTHYQPYSFVRPASNPYFMTKAILSSEPTPENTAAGHCLVAALFEVDSLGICRPGDQAWTCFTIRSLNGDGEDQEEEEEEGEGDDQEEGEEEEEAEGEGDDQEEGEEEEEEEEEEEDGGCACGYPINKGEFNKKDDEDDSELEEYESIKGDYEDVQEIDNDGQAEEDDSEEEIEEGLDDEEETFIVFKLDDETSDPAKWVRLENIGNQIIFLGRNHTKCVPAIDFPGFEGNCVYYSCDLWNHFHMLPMDQRDYADMGVYGLGRRVKEEFFPENYGAFMSNSEHSFKYPPIWITPNPW